MTVEQRENRDRWLIQWLANEEFDEEIEWHREATYEAFTRQLEVFFKGNPEERKLWGIDTVDARVQALRRNAIGTRGVSDLPSSSR